MVKYGKRWKRFTKLQLTNLKFGFRIMPLVLFVNHIEIVQILMDPNSSLQQRRLRGWMEGMSFLEKSLVAWYDKDRILF